MYCPVKFFIISFQISLISSTLKKKKKKTINNKQLVNDTKFINSALRFSKCVASIMPCKNVFILKCLAKCVDSTMHCVNSIKPSKNALIL